MGSNWLSVDNNFPTFTGTESLKEQVRQIHDFMPVLIESLKYQLNNLDSSNWNTKAMQTFQSDTTKEVEDALDNTDMELANLIHDLEELDRRLVSLAGRVTDNEIDISYIQKWKSEVTEQVDTLETALGLMQADADRLEQVIKVDEDGNLTLGAEGKILQLLGTVYLNGSLLGG